MSRDFIEQVFSTVDQRDAAGFAAFFAPEARFVFGNAEPIRGSAAIAEAVTGFFASIGGLHHRIANRWEVGADTVVEATVEYRRLDGGKVSVPAVSIWTRDGAGRITDYRIFADLAPLYAQ